MRGGSGNRYLAGLTDTVVRASVSTGKFCLPATCLLLAPYTMVVLAIGAGVTRYINDYHQWTSFGHLSVWAVGLVEYLVIVANIVLIKGRGKSQ